MKKLILLMMALVVGVEAQASMMGVPSIEQTFFSAERFGYTGSWTRHSTLADAMNGVGVVESGLMPQRDMTFYISQGVSGNVYDPEFDILTNWYSGGGAGNPSDTNYGFFQYYDADASTVTSLESHWNSDLTEFSLTASASGADYPNDFARFGERLGGPGSTTEGFFHSLNVDLTISDLAASFNPVTGRYESVDTAATSITGSLSGIVQNIGSDLSRHGYYVFQLNLNDTSWAYDNGHVASGSLAAYSTSAVPEPSSMALGLTALPIGLIWLRKRQQRLKQKRKQAA